MNNAIDIKIKTAYLNNESEPENDRYVFAYTITISNIGTESAKLMKRHWIITDANGHIEEVRGDGVIGEQPNLKPGETFEYTSGAILSTPVGAMEGSYLMLTEEGNQFDALIPAFGLAVPNILH